jgi:hypothetical protein
MPDTKVLADLLGEKGADFRGPKWPDNPLLFHSNPEWFQRLSSLDVLRDPEQWLDRAPSLLSFLNADALARSEARRRYLDGETIYIFGLDRTVIAASCDILAEIGPSEVLYPSLWGERPPFFRRHTGIVYCRLNVRSGTLRWHYGAEHTEVRVPL